MGLALLYKENEDSGHVVAKPTLCWVSYNPPLPSQDSEWLAHASLIDRHIWFFLTLVIHSEEFFFTSSAVL